MIRKFLMHFLDLMLHPEKCFAESTKILLAQQSFSFKYEPMEILIESTKKISLIFPIKKIFHRQQKTWNCKLK